MAATAGQVKPFSGFRVTLIVQARVISRPAMAASPGDAKHDYETVPVQCSLVRSIRCSLIHGSIHTWEDVVPRNGTMSLS